MSELTAKESHDLVKRLYELAKTKKTVDDWLEGLEAEQRMWDFSYQQSMAKMKKLDDVYEKMSGKVKEDYKKEYDKQKIYAMYDIYFFHHRLYASYCTAFSVSESDRMQELIYIYHELTKHFK